MAIYDFFLSRNNGPTLANYVGHTGRLFYDDATGEIRISDGVTLGGLPIPITVATASTVGGVKPGAGFTVTAGGTLGLNAGPMFELDGSDVFQLKAGTASRIGGIKAGSGVNIASDGTLTINLDDVEAFSFGDFVAEVGTYTDSTEYALLSSIKEDEDIVIASNGTGSVKVVGQFDIYKTNGTVTGSLEDEEPFFQVKSDGQVRILVPVADVSEGGLEIIGNTSGVGHPPNQSGVILHVTGNSPIDNVGQPCRNYFDSRDSYTVITGRRFNGPADSVTKVLNGETLLRVVGQASTDTGFQTFGPARVDFVATQDQAVGAQGGEVQIYATANNTAATSAVKVASFNGTTGVTSAVGFVGNLTGNASTVTNGVYTTDTATVTNNMLAGSIANAKLANSTISGIALGSTLAALSPGNYLTGTGYDGSTVRTFAVDATTTNTALKVVARDASGNFAAGTITANLTGTASTATNLAAATSILAGSLAIDPGNINKNTSSTQTFTLNGLTTSHKIIITPATVMPDRNYAIRGAWASATDTVSVEIVNNSGGNIDAGTIDLSYIAFV
jgi:hypothetical protein